MYTKKKSKKLANKKIHYEENRPKKMKVVNKKEPILFLVILIGIGIGFMISTLYYRIDKRGYQEQLQGLSKNIIDLQNKCMEKGF